MKFNFSWRAFLVLLPIGVTSAFGQADPQLVCDSISASSTRCGYTNMYSDPPKYYLHRVTVLHQDEYVGHCPEMALIITETSDPDTCIETRDVERIGYSEECFIEPACQGDCEDYAISDTESFCDSGFLQYLRCTFSNEYTTEMLIANTEAALPPYPGTFTGTCSAYRDLSSDETSYTIRRFRYKFTFPAGTQPFVIHWVERFSPNGGAPPSDTQQSEEISIGATESSVHEVLEPNSNGTTTIEDVHVDAATPVVERASIRDGEFVITLPAVDPLVPTGTLDLIFKHEGSNDQIVLKTLENQPPGTITVRLDDIMNVGATPLDGQDGIVFDRAAARWRIGKVDATSADRNLDVPVEVLSQRTLSNYFSPTWRGSWGGGNPRKGVYPAGQFPTGLYNVNVRTQLLNALDPFNEGLAMDGNTVIRAQVQPPQRGFQHYVFLNGTDRGYIEFPDRDQRNTASGSTVQFLRSTSVAVRPDADRLNYRTADQVYIPAFGIRIVDDAGGLHGNIHQIDVWIGQGDSVLKAQADAFGIQTRTCLKLLNQ